MSQVQPGGGSGERPGPGGKPPAPRRPAAKPGTRPPAKPGTRPTAKGRPPVGQGAKGAAGRGGGGKGTGRPNKTITAPPPRRFSPSTMGFVAIGVVIVIVLVFVIVKVTGGKSNPPQQGALVTTPFPAPASLVAQVTGVPASVEAAVGTGQGVSPPSVLGGQPALTSGGKPEVLFIGAEFCPYCAAERWAMLNAFSRFGTFTGVKETTSSPWDTPPAIATFSFRSVKYTSQYIDFVPVEHETNDTSGLGTRTDLEPLTKKQETLWTNYSSHFGENTGYPFVDMGNKVFVIGPSYNPDPLLIGLSQNTIAAQLTNAKSAVTQAIVGTANYLTASVCSLTHDQPSAVCSASGVQKAMTALKLN